MTIFVDADACPVVIRQLLQSTFARNKQISIYFVASYNHQIGSSHGNIFYVNVDTCREAADLYILNRVNKGDIVITQDIGLASIVLSKNAYAISHTGKQYTNETINQQLFFRHVNSKWRRIGHRTKGSKKYTKQHLHQFEFTLNKILLKEGLSSFILE